MKETLITYGAVANVNDKRGWLPIVNDHGYEMGSTWAENGYSEDDAIAMAEVRASEVNRQYVGDYLVIVKAK